MEHIKLADAKARLTPTVPDKAMIDVAALRALGKRLPRQRTTAARAIRSLREAERY